MRARWLPVVGALALLSACSGSEAPTAPEATPAPPAELNLAPPGCPSTLSLRADLTALYTQPGQILIVNLKYTGIEVALLARKTELARSLMYSLVQYTLDRYQKGELRGGQSSATQTKLVNVIKGLYCLVGLTAPAIPLGSLTPDGAVEIVQPGENTTVATDTKFAGVQVPAGAVTSPTLVTITRLPDFPGPLNTPLDQYPAYYQFTSSNGDTFASNVVVGTCQVKDFTPPDYNRLVLGHNVGTGIELLARVPAPFLDCSALISLQDPANSWFRLVSRGMRSLEPLAARIFLPQKAYAASAVGTCCLGGSSKSFSPFGAVDPLTVATAVSPTSFVGLAGGAVGSTQLPTVKVLTPQGNPLPGLTVTFSVNAGGGALTGTTQTTNALGVATLGGWTLGSGTGVVTATVTPLTGTSVSNNGLTFTAQAATQPAVSYLAPGYQYLKIWDEAPPSGFALPDFTGAASWPVGTAGFGSGSDSPDNCPLNTAVNSPWPAASASNLITSDLLLRHTFLVPTGWTAGASVRVAIDNDIQVFVNGTDITASAGSASLVDGFQRHEGCATRGSFTFLVPNSLLVPGGSNLVAVRARDRGRTSYVDVEVRLGAE
ncbi:MAG: hypothetical protein U0133_08275 [Gemmatimonadales bacterium]